MSLARDARRWLREHRHGLLSTHSLAVRGYPFGSIVPYVLDDEACPVFLVSRLAEHTRNMIADARVSLLVHEQDADVQAAARVTLIGNAERVADPSAIEQRYRRSFPETSGYREQLDFDYWRIAPVTLRVIAGFAKAHWLSREAYAPLPHTRHASGSGAIAQLNAEYAETLHLYCKLKQVANPSGVEVVALDCDGLDLQAGRTWLRLDFDDVVSDMQQARAALDTLAARMRNS